MQCPVCRNPLRQLPDSARIVLIEVRHTPDDLPTAFRAEQMEPFERFVPNHSSAGSKFGATGGVTF